MILSSHVSYGRDTRSTLGGKVLRRPPRVVVDEMPAVCGQCVARTQLRRLVGGFGDHDEMARFELLHVAGGVLTLFAQGIHHPEQPSEQPFALALRIDLLNTTGSTENLHLRLAEATRDQLLHGS